MIVGSASPPSRTEAHLFRWTEAEGMQELLPGVASAEAQYVNARGDVILGHFGQSVGGERQAFRWTPRAGLQSLGAVIRANAPALDGDLLLGTRADGAPVMTKFDSALASSPLPLDAVSESFVPPGWSATLFERISEDGRLLVGTAVNPDVSAKRGCSASHPCAAHDPHRLVP